MSMITGECNCYLDYIDNVVEFLPKPHNLTACSRVSIYHFSVIIHLYRNSCRQPN